VGERAERVLTIGIFMVSVVVLRIFTSEIAICAALAGAAANMAVSGYGGSLGPTKKNGAGSDGK
jgi:hypothetical protein